MFKRQRSAADWYELYLAAVAKPSYDKRVKASQGLVAQGADAVPYLRKLLVHEDEDAREDAAYGLGQLGTYAPTALDDLLGALSVETEHVPRDSIVMALGTLGDPGAIPALARLIRDPETDGDTQYNAVDSLGQLVGEEFHSDDNSPDAALRWLDANP